MAFPRSDGSTAGQRPAYRSLLVHPNPGTAFFLTFCGSAVAGFGGRTFFPGRAVPFCSQADSKSMVSGGSIGSFFRSGSLQSLRVAGHFSGGNSFCLILLSHRLLTAGYSGALPLQRRSGSFAVFRSTPQRLIDRTGKWCFHSSSLCLGWARSLRNQLFPALENPHAAVARLGGRYGCPKRSIFVTLLCSLFCL